MTAGRLALWGRQRKKPGEAILAAVLSLVVLAICGGVGLALKQPWLFPSLGPTAMLLVGAPKLPSARPLNAVIGHFVALLVGYGCILAFGLTQAQPAPVVGLTPAYVFAGSTAVAVTMVILELLQLPHPPAGATALIVSLGILDKPPVLLQMAGAIVLIVVLSWLATALLGRRSS